MSTFSDSLGKSWSLGLTVGLLREIRSKAGVDLGKAFTSEESLNQILFGEADSLVKVLWVVCEKQAQERGVSPEQFAYLFDGASIERATEALLSAVADFFPRSRIGRALKDKLKEILTEAEDQAIQSLSRLSLGNLPGSAGSTPPPGPSAKSAGPHTAGGSPSGTAPPA